MALPVDIILIWDQAAPPTGFDDVSATYAGRVRLAEAAGDEATGLGNAEHYHKSSADHGFLADHSPLHTHTGATTADTDPNDHDHTPGNSIADPHSHSYTTGQVVEGAAIPHRSQTQGVANDPASYGFMLIRNASATEIPEDALVLAKSAIASSFTKEAAKSGRLLQCGGDKLGGETGSVSHSDEINTAFHHCSNHYHDVAALDSTTPGGHAAGDGSGVEGPHIGEGAMPHTHPASPANVSLTDPGGATVQDETPAPNFADIYPVIKLMLWRADAASIAKDKVIALWDTEGNTKPVPAGWNVVAGTDGDYIYLDASGDGLSVPASVNHTTVVLKHKHTMPAHTHAGVNGQYTGAQNSVFDAGGAYGAYSDAGDTAHDDLIMGQPPNTSTTGEDSGYVTEDGTLMTDGADPGDPLAPPSFKILLIEKDGDDVPEFEGYVLSSN